MNPFSIAGIEEVSIDCGEVNYTIHKDNRHGIDGFRVSRYVWCNKGEGYFNWDESYQFYSTWDGVMMALHDTTLQDNGKRDF